MSLPALFRPHLHQHPSLDRCQHQPSTTRVDRNRGVGGRGCGALTRKEFGFVSGVMRRRGDAVRERSLRDSQPRTRPTPRAVLVMAASLGVGKSIELASFHERACDRDTGTRHQAGAP